MARLPQPGSDNGTWGEILNEYLSQSLKTDGSIKDNAVTNSSIAPDAITSTEIADGSITEAQLAGAVQTKLNANSGTPAWTDITGKPAVIAAGADQAAARTAIGAGTSNLALGTTSSTAKAGDYAPTKADVGLGSVDNTSDAGKPVSTATQTALNNKANDNVVVKLTGDQVISGNKTLTGNLAVMNNSGDTARVTLNNTDANQVFEFGVNTGGNWSVWDSSHGKGPLMVVPDAGDGGLVIETDRNIMYQQLDMVNNAIIGLPAPTDPTHAVRKSYVDGLLAGASQSSLPYVSTLGRWNTAVARRAVRHPRLLMVGDSATSARRSWQNQLAGRMYFNPEMGDEINGYRDVPFANGLYNSDTTRIHDIGGLTDIDLLVATEADEGNVQIGDYRYDEGPWTAWTLGDHWSTSAPPNGLIDKLRINDMNGATKLTARSNGHPNGTFWYGFNAKVSDAPLDVMSLAVSGVTAEWWKNQMTADISHIDNWGAATIFGLADGFDPDLIIIALGANDLDNPAIINDVDTHLGQIIDAWRTLQPNADIALQTYWQPNWGVVRDQVIATAAAKNVALLDFWPKIPTYAQHPGLYSDEYHLNDYGQRLLADIAIQQLGIPHS